MGKDKQSNKELVDSILIDQFNLIEKEVRPEAKLSEDLAIDSLDKIELIYQLEKEFDILIKDSSIDPTKTVQDVYDLVEKNS